MSAVSTLLASPMAVRLAGNSPRATAAAARAPTVAAAPLKSRAAVGISLRAASGIVGVGVGGVGSRGASFAPPSSTLKKRNLTTRGASTSTTTRIQPPKIEPPKPLPSLLKRLGLFLVAAGAITATLAAFIAPLSALNFAVATDAMPGLAATAAAAGAKTAGAGVPLTAAAKLGLQTLLRVIGATNILVATAVASLIPSSAPRKMRRVVEASMLVYGLCLITTFVFAGQGALWSVPGKWLAHSYGGLCVTFFAYCLLTE